MQGPKRGGRPATSWGDCLQENLEAFGAIPRKDNGRKWVASGVAVKGGRDWIAAAKNVGVWHQGVERGAEALDNAWRRADLRQSNVRTSARLVDLYSSYVRDFVSFFLVAVVSIGIFPAKYHNTVLIGYV